MQKNHVLLRKRGSLKAALTVQENFIINFTVSSVDEHEKLSSRSDYITHPKFDEVQTDIESLEENLDNTESKHSMRDISNYLLILELYCEEVSLILDFRFYKMFNHVPQLRIMTMVIKIPSNYMRLNFQCSMEISLSGDISGI